MKKLHGSSRQHRDIISYLPDPILGHIISSLLMKDAIRTQILSSRWRNLCSSLSNMEFFQDDFDHLQDFRKFVDKMLILHDGSDIQKFSLMVLVDDKRISADNVNTWITFAVQHNVQCLELHSFFSEKLKRLPRCLFTCSTISVLRLMAIDDLKWPTLINFPVLKNLSLQDVIFDDESVTTKLFSSSTCPALEILMIRHCNMDKIHTLSISFASLKSLEVHSYSLINVNLLIPSLRKIYYACPLRPNISCKTLSSLLDATFQIYVPEPISNEASFCSSARKILLGLHNVTTKVCLSSDFVENLARDPELLAQMPASYNSLKKWQLEVEATKYHVQVLTMLPRSSRNLRKLCISFEEGYWEHAKIIHMEEYWLSNKLSVGDALKHLKCVDIRGFGGTVHEMDFVKCLLESASILEFMVLACTYDMTRSADNGKKIMDEVLLFGRVSPHARIHFWKYPNQM